MIKKFIFVVGGVMSSVGKGVTSSSISAILKSHGYKTTNIKCDMYVNIDAGTIRPTEHGEVFVGSDGIEADQDLEKGLELAFKEFAKELEDSKEELTEGGTLMIAGVAVAVFSFKGDHVEVESIDVICVDETSNHVYQELPIGAVWTDDFPPTPFISIECTSIQVNLTPFRMNIIRGLVKYRRYVCYYRFVFALGVLHQVCQLISSPQFRMGST